MLFSTQESYTCSLDEEGLCHIDKIELANFKGTWENGSYKNKKTDILIFIFILN